MDVGAIAPGRTGRSRTQPWRSAWPWLLLCAAVIAVSAWWQTPRPLPPHDVIGSAQTPPAAADPSVATPDRAQRTAVRPEAGASTAEADDDGTFAGYLARLVALGLETARLAGLGDIDAAHRNDRLSRQVFEELMTRHRDADTEALAELGATPPATDTAPAAERLRERILHMVLDYGLRRRLASGEREALTRLVAAILTALPSSEGLARRLGIGLLADEPFLDLPHEAAVLDLVAMSGAGQFPVDVATALLSTLWHNLQQSGHRSSDQLAGLCLLLLEDGNRSERVAAGRLLLADDRYRLVVLEHLRTAGDAWLARELAMAAATALPPAQAFAVVSAAATIGGNSTAPFLMLGHRDAALLQSEYERRLADDVEPRLRELMVAGAGFGGSPEGIELARLAFDSDPDPDVRLRALFVLTGRAAAALGEHAVATAIDDARIHNDPQRLGAVVLALENLARAGLTNAVDRLGRQLRACPALSESSRATLEQILASSLPGGGSSGR